MPRPAEFDREKALDQAMRQFWCKGYEATSIQDLTESMGIKPGSLYNTFQDKHTLYLEALDRYQATVGGCIFDVLVEPLPLHDALTRFFAAVIDDELSNTEEKGCFIVNATLELAAHDEQVAARAKQAAENSQALFRTRLLQAQSLGELNPTSDVNALAAFLLGTVQGLRVMAQSQVGRAGLEAMVSITLSAVR
jgi:TetR/AcrR family transcriptional regulator, transcriptional repressor for nem operon